MSFWNIKYPYVNDEVLNLDWILSKVKEMQSKLDEWSATAEELKTALEDINTMKADIYTLKNDVDLLKANLRVIEADIESLSIQVNSNSRTIDILKEDIAALYKEIDIIFARIKSEVALLNTKIEAAKFDLQNDYNIKFEAVYTEIEKLKEAIEEIDTDVINPWHDELGRISPDENNKLIYSDLADGCLTAEEYCSLGYSAADFALFDIAALDYAKFSKKLLHFFWVYMPVEGIRQEISNVLTSIVDNVFNTLDSTSYSALDLDSDAYTALDLTATDYLKYNMNNSGILSVTPDGAGLSADQYEHININN